MFIHIGNNHILRVQEIISIINCDVIDSSPIMKEKIEHLEKENKVFGKPSFAKSMIITDHAIYFSKLSVQTLKKRTSIQRMVQKN